ASVAPGAGEPAFQTGDEPVPQPFRRADRVEDHAVRDLPRELGHPGARGGEVDRDTRERRGGEPLVAPKTVEHTVIVSAPARRRVVSGADGRDVVTHPLREPVV